MKTPGQIADVPAADPGTAASAPRPGLGTINLLARFALIGIVLAGVVGLFAYFGGWFSPSELTPARFTDALEQNGGHHPGFRRNHAKGVCVAGSFESNGKGSRLSRATVFHAGNVPVLGRFSLGVGNPHAIDTPDAVRGLGLQFTLPDGELWRTAMINLPVFPFRGPEGFYDQLVASRPDPSTGKPDPAKMKEFVARHPETVEALKIIKAQSPSSGFANSTFRSLNAFRFIDTAGNSTPVRWLLTPEQPFEAASAGQAAQDKGYLFDSLTAQLQRQPLRWKLVLIVGQSGDPTNDASLPWPAEREQVEVGTLTLDRVESDDTSEAMGINFDPLVLPSGIAPSDDPLLSARSAIYSQSFTRRAGETKQPADVRKGD